MLALQLNSPLIDLTSVGSRIWSRTLSQWAIRSERTTCCRIKESGLPPTRQSHSSLLPTFARYVDSSTLIARADSPLALSYLRLCFLLRTFAKSNHSPTLPSTLNQIGCTCCRIPAYPWPCFFPTGFFNATRALSSGLPLIYFNCLSLHRATYVCLRSSLSRTH